MDQVEDVNLAVVTGSRLKWGAASAWFLSFPPEG